MKTVSLFLVLLMAPLSGCLTLEPVEIAASHPANPSAQQSAPTGNASILRSYNLPKAAPPNLGEDHASPTADSTMDHSTMDHGDMDMPSSQTATLYTCPMHPEITRDQPGKCPICGMALVPKKPGAAAPDMEHNHDAMDHGTMSTPSPNAATLYTCPMHPEIVRDKPGRCPICGMALVSKTNDADASKGIQK